MSTYFEHYAKKAMKPPQSDREPAPCGFYLVENSPMDYATARAFQLVLATEKALDLTLVEEVNKQ